VNLRGQLLKRTEVTYQSRTRTKLTSWTRVSWLGFLVGPQMLQVEARVATIHVLESLATISPSWANQIFAGAPPRACGYR
jgi:hypothetical protein